MSTIPKRPDFPGRNILVMVIIAGLLAGLLPLLAPQSLLGKILASEEVRQADDDSVGPYGVKITTVLDEKLSLIEGNSVLAVSSPANPGPEIVKKINVIITAYSSSVWETDNDPFITASGTTVRDGIVATNLLPFNTKIRVPELYGQKIFIVEDRMHPRNVYQVDIWQPSYEQALNFGAKWTYIEVLKD